MNARHKSACHPINTELHSATSKTDLIRRFPRAVLGNRVNLGH